MEHLGIFSVAIAFLAYLAVCAVAGIVSDYKKRQAALEPVRAALERGHPVDPAIVERLMAPEARAAGFNPAHLRACGIITVALGIGLAILAVFLAQLAGSAALYSILGTGIVVVCVGAGLIIAARALETHARGTDTPAT